MDRPIGRELVANDGFNRWFSVLRPKINVRPKEFSERFCEIGRPDCNIGFADRVLKLCDLDALCAFDSC